MRRPASSALPSYAPDGRRASSMTSAAGIATATAAPTQRWHTRWWVLFYVVLGCYAISVLSSFIVGLEPEPPTHQDGIHEQQRVLHHQKVVETGPIKVETAAKDPSEPEEGWPVQESEREDAADAEQGEIPGELEQEQEAAGEIGAREDEHAEAAPDKVAAPIGTESPTEAPTTTALSSITASTGPASTIPSAVETQTALMNPTRQNDVVLLAATQEEEEKKELNGEPDDRKAVRGSNDGTSKDHNEAEADIQAPQEKWEVEDSGTNDAAETPGPLVTPTSDETQPPVRRSDEFYKALDLVYPYETKPPNPYFHVFPIEIHDKLISEEKDRLEDKRAASTLDIRRHQPRKIRNKLKCMGWRQTGQCNPYGKREPNSDLACNQIAQGGVSGYCEVDKLDSKYWTHLQSFKWEQDVSVGDGEEIMFPANRTAVQRMMSYQDIKQKYQIGIQPSGPLFKEFETCYGAEPNVVSNYNLTKFEDLPFANLEQQLVDYAHEGALLMAQAQGRMGV
ncbi:hypothetical protein PC113_g10721 [Phytophthora cactorum]|uniref:Uncharacterized protein n=1 Tax=Phytophthora cactorum TaxID=29920 RepID=A0A8T0Z5W5_9STRA|nr:hypothetical protein PC113_g10721 [Phytophthora cactorum]